MAAKSRVNVEKWDMVGGEEDIIIKKRMVSLMRIKQNVHYISQTLKNKFAKETCK